MMFVRGFLLRDTSAEERVNVCQVVTFFRRKTARLFSPQDCFHNWGNVLFSVELYVHLELQFSFKARYKLLQLEILVFVWWLHFVPHVKHGVFLTSSSVNICGFLQKSHGNGPLNRLLMAAKRKYMETELPPQESEGKTRGSSQF